MSTTIKTVNRDAGDAFAKTVVAISIVAIVFVVAPFVASMSGHEVIERFHHADHQILDAVTRM